MTLRDVVIAINGFVEYKSQSQQTDWERTRWQTANMVSSILRKKIQPKQLIKFPWEKSSLPKMSKEFMQQLDKEFTEKLNKEDAERDTTKAGLSNNG